MPSEAYQERKNANAEQNQPDRSLVIGGDLHCSSNQISLEGQNSSALFRRKALISGCAAFSH